MGDLAPHLSHDAIDQALEIAQSLVDEYARSLAISSIGPYLSSHMLEKALAIIEGFENEHNHYRAIIRLASRLPRHLDETIYRRILRICDSIHEASVSAKILTGLVRNAPESIQEEALKDLLQVPSDPGHSTRIAALTSLLPDLPAKARPRVLDECTKGISELTSLDQQTKVFCQLTAYLSLEELHKMADDLVSRSYKARGSVHRIRNLSRLVHFLSDEHIEQLMLDVTNDDLRGATSAEKAAILTTIGKHVEGSQGHHLLRKAVTAGLESLSEKPEKPQDLDVQAFADVVKNLPNDLTQEALRAASSLERPEAKALALAALIPHLEFDCRVETAMRAYMSARAVENHRQRSMCLATVVNNVLILQRQQRLCILESIVWLLRREHRAKAYREIAALAPILFSLEIDNISRKMIDNIGMVEEWWP